MKNLPLVFALASGVLAAGVAQAETATKPQVVSKNADRVDQKLIDDAISKIYPALVRIHVVMEFAKDGRMERAQGSGSGSIVHKDGYILTNHHVAGDASRVWVRLSNKLKVDAEVVGTDPQTDLCVLKLNMDQIPANMKPLPVGKFGDFKTLEVGDTVLAMGSPAGVSQSVTLGVVANLEMITPDGMGQLKQSGEVVGDLVRWIGHDAVIYFGNSGGPLVNLKGEIIGVNEIGLGSLGGAIPADIAKYVTSELIQYGKVRRSWIGLYPQPVLRSSKLQNGVLAASVIKDSPAAKAGLQAGDVITHVNGIAVKATAREHLPLYNRLVLGAPVGKELEIKFVRDGEKKVAKVLTIARVKAQGEDLALKGWGVTARDLTTRSALARKRANADGVYVSSVSKSGAAAAAKPALQQGDVILSVAGKKVKNVSELTKVSKALLQGKKEQDTVVEFERKGELLATVVRVGRDSNKSNSVAASHAWVGVKTQVLTKQLAKALDLKGKKGVRVTKVFKNSNAGKAGIKNGDVIVKIDGAKISASLERDKGVFSTMIREYDSDSTVEFDIYRAGKKMKISCALEPSPKKPSEFRKLVDDTLEFTLRELAKADSVEENTKSGIYVESIKRAGWAALAGLKGGDVIQTINGEKVKNLDDFEKKLSVIKKEQAPYIVLFVKRGKFSRFVEIHPIWEDVNTKK